MFKDSVFREYDIRGVYPEDFDENFAFHLGRAYCLLLMEQKNTKLRVSVGFDSRVSSPEISQALIQGLVSCGAKVFHLGLITTPMSYFSLFQMNLCGAIMVTGSHNPCSHNGFKLSIGKTTIFGDQIQKLKKLMNSKPSFQKKGSVEDFNISNEYVERYREEFLGIQDPGIVLDCGNGAGGVIARPFYEALGLKPEILFEKPDGLFPNHHPDPTVEENTLDLKKTVIAKKARIGIGFDGDADRIGVVDEKGRFVFGDEIMMVLARDILKHHPGSKMIADVKCSDRFYNDIEQRGGKAIMWKTGHSLIKNKIKQEKAIFGGEFSGHIFFADRNYGYDDALYAGLRLIEILGQTGKTMDQLLEGIPKSFHTPEIRMETKEKNKTLLIKKLVEHFSDTNYTYPLNTIDGIRICFPDGWALIRSSNTQSVITLRFESRTQKGLDYMKNNIVKLVDPLL